MPIPALIGIGLSLLPKLPELWGGIAGLFGKKVPDTIKDAGKLAGEVSDMIRKGEISPDIQVQLEMKIMEYKERIQELLIEEKKIDLESKRIEYDEIQSKNDLEIAAYKSGDEYVARTRPMILRKLFGLVCLYSIYAPLCVIAAYTIGLPTAAIVSFTEMIYWIGGFLFGTFGTSYLGYSAARSLDKRNPNIKNGNGFLGTFMNKVV
uniref:Putative holin n=1 Tax=viral metagenome TaxID=1070528 RepID=A0A6M3IS22_9ZZZZ